MRSRLVPPRCMLPRLARAAGALPGLLALPAATWPGVGAPAAAGGAAIASVWHAARALSATAAGSGSGSGGGGSSGGSSSGGSSSGGAASSSGSNSNSSSSCSVQEIKLHKKEKLLEVVFDDGVAHRFSAELLRVRSAQADTEMPHAFCSHAACVRAAALPAGVQYCRRQPVAQVPATLAL